MKSTLRLLESSYDIWNFHKDSEVNYISPICRLFELLINGRMKQKIPVFFNCLNNAFELSEQQSPQKPAKPVKKKFGFDDLGGASKPKPSSKFRRTISNTSGGMDKKSLFQKLNMFLDVKKLANHMVKMLEYDRHPEVMKREIRKYVKHKIDKSSIETVIEKLESEAKNIMLFFIGGITQNEIFAINRLARTYGKRVFIITTNIINSNSFYNMF